MKYLYLFCIIVDAFLTGVDVAKGTITGWTYVRQLWLAYFSYLLLKEGK